MDSRLAERLTKWHEQIEKLQKVEETFLSLEAGEESIEGACFIKAQGNNIAEREAIAANSTEWRDYKENLALHKANYLHEKRMLELKVKAYESEYLTMKLEAEAIRKMV